MFKNKFVILSFIVFFQASNSWAYSKCETGYLNALEERMQHAMGEGHMLNFWNPTYEYDDLVKHIKTISTDKRLQFLDNLKVYVDKSGDRAKDIVYNKNITALMNELLTAQLIKKTDLRKIWGTFKTKKSNFVIGHGDSPLYYSSAIDKKRTKLVDDFLKTQKLGKNNEDQYRNILLASSAEYTELEAAIKGSIKLRDTAKDMARFREYMVYLNKANSRIRKKGLKKIDKIYNYAYKHKNAVPTMFMSVEKKFLNELSRAKALEERRFKKIVENLKIQDDIEIRRELEDIAAREVKGQPVSSERREALTSRLKQKKITPQMKKEARRLASGEARVYKNLLSNCFHGNKSKALLSAAKKFSRFKMFLSLSLTPYFYLSANKDRKDKDIFFWERLGYEMGVSVIFTMIGNKIMTNTNSSFFQKYWQGQWKYSAMSVPTDLGYDALFENQAYFKYIKNFYSKDKVLSPIDKRSEDLLSSPHFKQDFAELVQYVELKSKETNLQFYINKYLNLDKEFSNQDPYKITQEDLLSNEGQEFLLELVAEELYYKDMGEWAMMQSGNKGADIWLFSRGASAPIGGLISTTMAMATLQLLCVQPFGRVGTWAAVVGLTLAERMATGNLTYNLRAQAINR